MFSNSLRTNPIVMLRQVRFAIENQWHWPSATQLGEDAHRCSQHNSGQVLALLRSLALKLRSNSFGSISAGLKAVGIDIIRMRGCVDVNASGTE